MMVTEKGGSHSSCDKGRNQLCRPKRGGPELEEKRSFVLAVVVRGGKKGRGVYHLYAVVISRKKKIRSAKSKKCLMSLVCLKESEPEPTVISLNNKRNVWFLFRVQEKGKKKNRAIWEKKRGEREGDDTMTKAISGEEVVRKKRKWYLLEEGEMLAASIQRKGRTAKAWCNS